MSRKDRQTPIRSESSIDMGTLYFEDVKQAELDTELFTEMLEDRHLTTIRVCTLGAKWLEQEWMTGVGYTKFEISVQMTLRKETRSGGQYWYAYRRAGGKLYKRYVGTSAAVNAKRLIEVARKLPGV